MKDIQLFQFVEIHTYDNWIGWGTVIRKSDNSTPSFDYRVITCDGEVLSFMEHELYEISPREDYEFKKSVSNGENN